MKVKYSSVLEMCWKMYSKHKQQMPERSTEEIYSLIHDRYESMKQASQESLSSIASLRAWELWYSDYKKEFLHIFFIDNILKEILENIKIKVDNVKDFVKEKGIPEIMWNNEYNANIEAKVFFFGIHLPHIRNGYAFKLMLYDNKLNVICIRDDVGGFEIDEKAYLFFTKKNEKAAERKIKMFQLCINTILYMDCYPECIIQGVPDDINQNIK